MEFNQPIKTDALIIKAVNSFNDQGNNLQFSYKKQKNEIVFLINPKNKFDLCCFASKITNLFHLNKEKDVVIMLNSFLQLCPNQNQKDVVFVLFNKLAMFNEKCLNFKSTSNDYEVNIIYSQKYEPIVNQASIISQATSFVKYLQTAPANIVNLEKFVFLVNKKLKKINKKLKLTILDDKRLTKQHLNLIVAVNKGSNEQPKLLILEYKNNKCNQNIALVGKGIIFDAGGYSLKPANYMVNMHQDMAGASAVVGTIFTLAKADKKVNVVGAIPLAKNLVCQHSYLVNDVYQAYNKKTVEILNTDAEGRLILADAISYVSKNFKISKLLTISTLTGLSARCFGDIMTPYWSSNSKTAKLVKFAFDHSGEHCVNIPLLEEHTDMVKKSSNIADFANITLKTCHSDNSFAAAFLKEFSYCQDFTHIDIAGTIEYKKYPVNPFSLILYNFVVESFKNINE